MSTIFDTRNSEVAKKTYSKKSERQQGRAELRLSQLRKGETLDIKGRTFIAELPVSSDEPFILKSGSLVFTLINNDFVILNFLIRLAS